MFLPGHYSARAFAKGAAGSERSVVELSYPSPETMFFRELPDQTLGGG